MKPCLLLLLLVLPALAQKDFLTDSEIEKVREVQEPVGRIRLYLSFAKQRVDQLQSTMAKDRAGRSAEVRQLLDDYSKIIDAIDTVSDDALIRRADTTAMAKLIADGEKKFLDQLAKIQATNPHDLDMYEFELKEAIETTSDSIDLAGEVPDARTATLDIKAANLKKEVADINKAEKPKGPATVADHAEAAAVDATKPARKPPTLYRPGEKPDDKKPDENKP